jgi:hypothetical protein
MNTDEIDIDKEGLVYEKPHFFLNGNPFIPRIYEIRTLNEIVPEGYNTVAIPLDGKVSADLDWKSIEAAAEQYQAQGLQLFWNLDLGLFKALKAPLPHQSQFLSLILSLEHFRDTLWKKFKEHTLGVCLYRGPADFSSELVWEDHLLANYAVWHEEVLKENQGEDETYYKVLFARDAAAEYLTMMANRMPDGLQLFLELNIDPYLLLMMEAQLINRERFDRFHLKIQKNRLPADDLSKSTLVGVCLPNFTVINPKIYRNLARAFEHLFEQKIPFRIIPEAFLIHEWDGLDYLIVEPSGISALGKRKLQGFCAAGGTIIHADTHNEINKINRIHT